MWNEAAASKLKPMDAIAISLAQAKQDHIQLTIQEEKARLLNFIRQFVPRMEEAEDIMQDVFYQFIIGYDDIRSIDKSTSWLYRVARNKVIDSFRKKKPQAFTDMLSPQASDEDGPLMLEEILPRTDSLPDEEVVREMIWAKIEESLDELPAKQRAVFVMHEFEQKSFREMADITGDTINTLLSRKRYAVLALRKALQELYDELKGH